MAAFFAFRHVPQDAETVRIFGYRSCDDCALGKSYDSSVPGIYTVGPFAVIHERHVAQQCNYTFCGKADENGEFLICSHEEAPKGDPWQDVYHIWDIDSNERDKVLAELFFMNITPFTLFRSIDAAAETAALRVFGTGCK